MRSSFTAMALALAFVTVTALPAVAFTLSEKPVGGLAAEAPPADQLLDLQMGVAPGTPQASGPSAGDLAIPGGAEAGILPPPTSPQSSAVAVFPSRNQPTAAVVGQKVRLPQASVPSAAVVGQKVRSPQAAAPSAKPAEFAPQN